MEEVVCEESDNIRRVSSYVTVYRAYEAWVEVCRAGEIISELVRHTVQ